MQSASQWPICFGNSTYCHTETEAAAQTCYLIQSQCPDTRPTRPSNDPLTAPAFLQGLLFFSFFFFFVTGLTRPWTAGSIPKPLVLPAAAVPRDHACSLVIVEEGSVTRLTLTGCFLACLMSKQHARVSQGQICSNSCTCCHTEKEVADPSCYLTQSQTGYVWQRSKWLPDYVWLRSNVCLGTCDLGTCDGGQATTVWTHWTEVKWWLDTCDKRSSDCLVMYDRGQMTAWIPVTEVKWLPGLVWQSSKDCLVMYQMTAWRHVTEVKWLPSYLWQRSSNCLDMCDKHQMTV